MPIVNYSSLKEVINIFKVYCITNLINNHKYIGITSRSLKIRFSEHCCHPCTLIYDAVKKYGKENFIIELIEDNVPNDLIDEKERYYINKYNTLKPNGYNLSTGGISNKDVNEETRQHLKEINLGINNPRCNKYILQYDLNNNFIAKYGSAREAGRALGNENKYRAILNCLNKKTKTSQGYTWKYED